MDLVNSQSLELFKDEPHVNIIKSIVNVRNFDASTDPHDSILIDTVSEVTKEVLNSMSKVERVIEAEVKFIPRAEDPNVKRE